MSGLKSTTGEPVSGLEHLSQSIRIILSTPLGTRVMRRDFGSRLPDLVDAPANAATILDIRAATAEAILRWEPRFEPEQIDVTLGVGRVEIEMSGLFLPDGRSVNLEGIVVA